jgi:hypothetical protein
MNVQMNKCGHSLTYFRLHKFPQLNTMMELNMRSTTAIDYYSFCLEVCTEILQHLE